MTNILKKSLRVIFAGTNNFSAYYLNSLIHAQYQVIAIISQKYIPATYEKYIYINSIQEIAIKHKLPILQPYSLSTNEILTTIKQLNPDIIIVVSYGLIIPKIILQLPPLGCINVHGSLLPRWRGPAPIQRAIEAGDTITGISIIQMDSGIDTGNILNKATCKILPNDTSLSLFKKLADIGIKILLHTLTELITKIHNPIPQNNNFSTYAKKINKIEGKINWNMSTIQIDRKIRAFNPWPTSYFQTNKKKIKIWKAKINNIHNINQKNNIQPGTILLAKKSQLIIATNDGSLKLTLVQEEGKKIISIKELLNSKKHWFTPGSVLEN